MRVAGRVRDIIQRPPFTVEDEVMHTLNLAREPSVIAFMAVIVAVEAGIG